MIVNVVLTFCDRMKFSEMVRRNVSSI